MKKIKITENQLHTLIKKLLSENKDYYDFWDIISDMETDILYEFLEDKEKGKKQKTWVVIEPPQYQKALSEFVKHGQLVRFPTKIIDKWERIIIRNTAALTRITEYAGHSTHFPFDGFFNVFRDLDEEEYDDYEKCSDYLEELGFFDWTVLPDGSQAWSDYGIEPLLKLLKELEDNTTYEQKLVTINKILDVYHQRGDLASAFIRGGASSLSAVSGTD